MSNFRKPQFFTSDLHLFHDNCLRFDKRPFDTIEEMHQSIINRFNSTVPVNGITYFLGDIGEKGSEKISSVINQLNGTKVLCLGNHDSNPSAMYRCGFDVVVHSATIYIANQRVTMSHCPLMGVYREDTKGMRGTIENENWHGELGKKNKKLSFTNEGQFHLHGHIHSPNGGKSKKILDKQFDVGVVANNYAPVSISRIESWIAIYRRDNE